MLYVDESVNVRVPVVGENTVMVTGWSPAVAPLPPVCFLTLSVVGSAAVPEPPVPAVMFCGAVVVVVPEAFTYVTSKA